MVSIINIGEIASDYKIQNTLNTDIDFQHSRNNALFPDN